MVIKLLMKIIKNKMIKAIIFDFDGVVVDSFDTNFYAMNYTLKKFNYAEIPRDFYSKRYGSGPVKMITDHFKEKNIPFDEDKIKKIAKLKTKNTTKFLNKSKVIPGIHNFLEKIQSEYKLAIASNNKKLFIKECLKYHELDTYFKIIVDMDEVKNLKPAPDLFLKASSSLNINPNECIVIEDTFYGIKACKNAGMKCIALTTTNKKENLIKADLIVDDFTELSINKLNQIIQSSE